MNNHIDTAISEWAEKQRPSQARLNQIMVASRQVNEMDAQWWKSQFTVMRNALRQSQKPLLFRHFA